ncbi:ABC transporter permease [Persicobacter psychrovividus]|uniref:D,D-dipeptide transport system permease protein DdpB n=1 Tax=Persicobacter psychrovividus TaxID=387638 RepID=A0ABM7VHI7_9BACT|nr:putative D,D-dipeptide transport system permease protein DdpB [Persicobacter psychrovividus]
MLRYLLHSLLYGCSVLFGVIVVVFLLFHALPGDPAAMLSGQRSDVATVEMVKKELGLDQSLGVQFAYYLNDLSPVSVHQDTPDHQKKYDYRPLFHFKSGKVLVVKAPYLRRSFQNNRPVSSILMSNIGPTLTLAFSALFIATLIGISLGLIAGLWPRSFADKFISVLSVFGLSVPTYVLAILMAVIFGYYLAPYTGLNITGQLYERNPLTGEQVLVLKNLILPAITLSLRPLAVISQISKTAIIDVIHQDFVKTARAKGLRYYRQILIRHILPNAMNPIISSVTNWLANLIAGAFFVEYIFDWKGIGFATLNAVQRLDFPVVMGATLFIASCFILINILTDLIYAIHDSRNIG